MLFLAMVMLSVARKAMHTGGPGPGLEMLRAAAQRSLLMAWSKMDLLGLSGIYLAWDHWGIRPGVFFSEGGRFLNILQAKAILFSLVVMLSLMHDFWLGPKILER